MKSKFKCPSCEEYLDCKIVPEQARLPYTILYCLNVRCTSDVAQREGGSGPTAEAAYRALLNAVEHENDPEYSPEVIKEREADACAERKAERERDGGV